MRQIGLMLFLLMGLNGAAQIVATTSFLADITQNIIGKNKKVISLLPIGSDPHIYEPVPGDVRILADAEVIVKNGLHLEGWLDKVLEHSGTKALVVTATDGIEPISAQQFKNAYDPHAWMSVRNAKIYTQNIARSLVLAFPELRNEIEQNERNYSRQLDELDRWIVSIIKSIPEKQRVLFTSHDAFRYLGRDYGIRVESILGTSTDADIRIEDLDRMIAKIDETGVAAIFVESTINPKMMQQIAKDSGVKIGGNLFADSLGPKESGAGTYMDMLRHDIQTLVDGLAQKREVGPQDGSFWGFLGILTVLLLGSWIWLGSKVRQKISSDLFPDGQLEITNISVTYDQVPVFSHLHVTLHASKIYGMVGPNGSGKSTLVKAILGHQPLESGAIVWKGRDLSRHVGEISYVPQKDEIDFSFPATAFDVVKMGQYRRSISAEEIQVQMERLGIWGWRNRPIGQLSGGQQQRCFVARALVQNAPILILDEPFVGIDATTEAKIMEVLKAEAKRGKLILVIHHDLSKVKQYFDEVLMMNRRLVASGSVEQTFTAENIEKTFSAPGIHFHQAQQLMKS
jgi:ABC-type Zn uptake system ZnuABC Zn-binding protein ZnuA/ABC-type Mn2+/Zn2+ transport system ATPase subunit